MPVYFVVSVVGTVCECVMCGWVVHGHVWSVSYVPHVESGLRVSCGVCHVCRVSHVCHVWCLLCVVSMYWVVMYIVWYVVALCLLRKPAQAFCLRGPLGAMNDDLLQGSGSDDDWQPCSDDWQRHSSWVAINRHFDEANMEDMTPQEREEAGMGPPGKVSHRLENLEKPSRTGERSS